MVEGIQFQFSYVPVSCPVVLAGQLIDRPAFHLGPMVR